VSDGFIITLTGFTYGKRLDGSPPVERPYSLACKSEVLGKLKGETPPCGKKAPLVALPAKSDWVSTPARGAEYLVKRLSSLGTGRWKSRERMPVVDGVLCYKSFWFLWSNRLGRATSSEGPKAGYEVSLWPAAD
jgi:hypothetical protein